MECQKPSPCSAHILYSTKNEKYVNIQMGGMYNKTQKISCAVADFPEVQAFRFVPFEATNKISQTALRKDKLQEDMLMQQWALERHHSIPCWGLVNIYKVVTAPNSTEFIICQVIISTKSVQDLISFLFNYVDQSPEVNVVVICDVSMKEEAEAHLSHFGIYLGVVYLALLCGRLLLNPIEQVWNYLSIVP